MKLNIFIILVVFLFIISLITSSLSIKESMTSLTFRKGRKNEPVLEMGDLVSKGEEYSSNCEKICERSSDCKFSILHNGKPDRRKNNMLKGQCYITQSNIDTNEFYQIVNKNLKNNKQFQIKENKGYKQPAFKARLKYVGNKRKPNKNKNRADCLGFNVMNIISPVECNKSAILEFKPYENTDYYTINDNTNYLNDFQKGNPYIQKPIRCRNNKCRNIGQFKLKKIDDDHITIVNKSGNVTNYGKGWTSFFRSGIKVNDRNAFNENDKKNVSEHGVWKLEEISKLRM